MKIQYREFEDPALIAMAEGVMKIPPKNQTDIFDFFGVIFITHHGSCDDCEGVFVGGWVTKIATEKFKPTFQFFRRYFHHQSRVLQ